MAILDLTTGNSPKIIGKIEYSLQRTDSQYTIYYTVSMRRTNSWTGQPTSGTIAYNVYINGVAIESATKDYVVPNDNSWSQLCSGAKTYGLSALQSTTYTIGFNSQTKTTGVTGFNVALTTSGANIVSAYASAASGSTVNISFTSGKSVFTLFGAVGKGGTNNAAQGCVVYYTTNGTTPSTTNGTSFTISGAQDTTWQKDISFNSDCTVKAVAYTIAPYGNVAGSVATQQIYYYSAPSKPTNLNITYAKKPTTKTTYTLSWNASNNGYNNVVDKYVGQVFVNNIKRLDFVCDSQTLSTTYNFHNLSVKLNKGDVLQFKLYAQGKSAYNNISQTAQSPKVTVVSAGVIKIKINGNWTEGQVWIKNGGIWKEATEVFIKNNGKWNSSI